MKKIFTLIAATVITIASFAADRRPSVTLTTNRNYEVIIDGQSYISSRVVNLDNLRKGSHTIKVYEVSTSRFRKIKKLVSASTFQLRNEDLDITVNRKGQIDISKDRFDHHDDHNSGGWGHNDRDHRF